MTREMTKKERLAIPRHPMPARDPSDRIRDFQEVATGYTEELALGEAERCLECKKPKCVDGCPVGIDIPSFVRAVAEGRFAEALAIIKADNTLPAICGRVCPQEDQCEKTCVTGNKGRSVAIGRLERFVADLERAGGTVTMPECAEPSGFKVGIVGSGPAGLSCAATLAMCGHSVTVFEALHQPGGVLTYGIPEFRLPKSIVQEEIQSLSAMGVEFRCNFVVGSTATVDELMNDWGYDALFIGTGAGLPYFMNIPGENLIGVCSANEFLTRVNLMRAYDFPDYDTPVSIGRRVAVVGAGNVAMDCCRTALRLGCEKVICLYRRTRDEAPARIEEIEHAEEEGIDFRWLTNPVKVLGNEQGLVTGIRVQKMELGEPDASGRPRPVPAEGSEYDLEIDSIIIGIGQGANPLLTSATEGLDVDKRGRIVTHEETTMTSIPGVFAGGDIVTGAATVILAMGAGKRAAGAIDAYLRGVPFELHEQMVEDVDAAEKTPGNLSLPAVEPETRTQNGAH
jgi:glutamate synthase (NADPH/NADH) small chain